MSMLAEEFPPSKDEDEVSITLLDTNDGENASEVGRNDQSGPPLTDQEVDAQLENNPEEKYMYSDHT